MISAALAACLAAAPPVICLDPGHPSEGAPGTRGKLITEVKAVWLVAQKAKPLLEAKGYRVVLTKGSEGQFVGNRQRAAIANKAKAALFLRLHMDAGAATGFGTYYPAQKGKAFGVTGPSDRVIASSRSAAKAFHPAAMKALGGRLKDRGVLTDMDTGVGRKNGGALVGSIFSEVPVLLLEMATLTNKKDEAFAASKKGQELLAKAIAEGADAAVKALSARAAARR